MSVTRIVSVAGLSVALAFASTAVAQPVELVLTSATIQPKKANGDGWDPFGGSPDAYVIVKARQPGGVYITLRKTSSCSDTYSPDWDAIAVPLQTNEEVSLEVWDGDFDADDPIGTYTFTLTRERIAEGDTRVSFGQVKEMRLILEAPSLRASELERRFRAVEQLAFGTERHPVLTYPFTADRIKAHHSKIRLTSTAVLKGERPTFERLIAAEVANMITMRLGLTSETTPRERRDDLVAWIDSYITHRCLVMKEFEFTMETARRYLKYKHEEKLGRNREEDRELTQLLVKLETALQKRVAFADVLILEDGGESATEARRRLPAELRDADAAELRKHLAPALDEVIETQIQFRQAIQKHFPALLVERFAVASDKERQLKDGGRVGEQRLDLERSRARTSATQVAYLDAASMWQLDGLRLMALCGHSGCGYAGKGSAPSQSLTLPESYDLLLKRFGNHAPNACDGLRGYVDHFDKMMDQDEGFWIGVADWFVLNWEDVAAPVLDAAVDDLTRWMGDMPAMRGAVKGQILGAIGFPEGKARCVDLGPSEFGTVSRNLVMSMKDIRRSFNRDTIYRVRQDLDLLRALMRDYPARDLITVEKPHWASEPTGRLTLTKCYGLTEAEAARAYQRIFEQLREDTAAVNEEVARFFIRINLKMTYHARAMSQE